jgi:hypothetical protein
MKRPALIAKTITKALTIALVTALIWPLAAHTDDFYPARVKNISDRAYENAVLDLIDSVQDLPADIRHVTVVVEHPE